LGEADRRRRVQRLHQRLLAHHGPQNWWPARSRFEMMIGAVLVQNTAWRNVEPAVASLREQGLLGWKPLSRASLETIAGAVRSAGTYRVKARRLRALASFIARHRGLDTLSRWPTPRLREALTGVHGVGAETADAMLVYAFSRPSFIIDAYTRRVCARLGLFADAHPRDDAARRGLFERALPRDAHVYGECHALIVAHAKTNCRATPRCADCPVRRGCGHHASGATSG
jgi:endonuclease-3 related protein